MEISDNPNSNGLLQNIISPKNLIFNAEGVR